MKIIYIPEGEKQQDYVFKPLRTPSADAEAIERVGGEDWSNYREFCTQLEQGRLKAARAALWTVLKREQNPRLQFAELVVFPTEIVVAYDEDEITEARARAKSGEIPEDLAAEILSVLGDDEGKDEPSESSEPPTDSDSPEPDSTD